MLALAEFAYNNSHYSIIKISPFFAYYKFYLQLNYKLLEEANVPNAGERIRELVKIRGNLVSY
jgi:hypothetical protein